MWTNFYFHMFQTPIEWTHIKQMKSKDMPLSFMIKLKNNSKKNLLFIIPRNYPFKGPIIFINGYPLNKMKGKDDATDNIISLLTIEWSPVYTIIKFVKLLEAFLI